MTYRDYIEKLRMDFQEKTQTLLNAEKALTDEPTFMNKEVLDRYMQAKFNWQNSANQYNSIFDFIKSHRLNLDDELYIPQD